MKKGEKAKRKVLKTKKRDKLLSLPAYTKDPDNNKTFKEPKQMSESFRFGYKIKTTENGKVVFTDKKKYFETIIKKAFRPKVIVPALVVSIAFATVFLPQIMQSIETKNTAKIPIQAHTPSNTLTNPNVTIDQNGSIVVNPVNNEELAKAYQKLKKTLVNTFNYFGKTGTQVDDILGIWSHRLKHSNHSDEMLIDILVSSGDKNYILRYKTDGLIDEQVLETNYNDTQTISSFIALLQSSYKVSATEVKEHDNSWFAAPSFDHTLQSTKLETRIPVYSPDLSLVFTLDPNKATSFYEEGLSLEEAFDLFLKNQNDYFEEHGHINNELLTDVAYACDNAQKLNNSQDLSK